MPQVVARERARAKAGNATQVALELVRLALPYEIGDGKLYLAARVLGYVGASKGVAVKLLLGELPGDVVLH